MVNIKKKKEEEMYKNDDSQLVFNYVSIKQHNCKHGNNAHLFETDGFLSHYSDLWFLFRILF